MTFTPALRQAAAVLGLPAAISTLPGSRVIELAAMVTTSSGGMSIMRTPFLSRYFRNSYSTQLGATMVSFSSTMV